MLLLPLTSNMFKMSQCNCKIVYRDNRPAAEEVDPTDFSRSVSTEMTQSIVVLRKQTRKLGKGFLHKMFA